jgi:hypothetical protein
MAKTEAGYWLGTEPVDVERVADAEALKAVLLRVIGRGNPIVPTPSRLGGHSGPAIDGHLKTGQ